MPIMWGVSINISCEREQGTPTLVSHKYFSYAPMQYGQLLGASIEMFYCCRVLGSCFQELSLLKALISCLLSVLPPPFRCHHGKRLFAASFLKVPHNHSKSVEAASLDLPLGSDE
jgi:hypothetical protein